MYYQRLLLLFPDGDPGIVSAWYVVLMFAGMLLSVAGARLGQGTITLGFVALGAFAGKLLPAFLGVKLDPMATTCAAAFVTGIFGYLTHRWITGLGLSLLVVAWTVLGFWMTATEPAKWIWPIYPGGTAAFLPYLQLLQAQLGKELALQMAPFAAVALLASLAFYTLLPKVATTLFWTLAGVTLTVLSAVGYAHYHAPGMFAKAPTSVQGQTLVLGAATLFGLVCQSIRLKPKAAAAPAEDVPRVQPMAA